MISVGNSGEVWDYTGSSLIESLSDGSDLTYATIDSAEEQDFFLESPPNNSISVKNFSLSMRLKKTGLFPPSSTVVVNDSNGFPLVVSALIETNTDWTNSEISFTILNSDPDDWINSEITFSSTMPISGNIQISELSASLTVSLLNSELSNGGVFVAGNSTLNEHFNPIISGGVVGEGNIDLENSVILTIISIAQYRSGLKSTMRSIISAPIWNDRINPLIRLWVN